MLRVYTFDDQGLPRKEIDLKPPTKLIDRQSYQTIKDKINRNEIEVILGPRQCGKTTLLYQLIDHLQKEKGISSQQIVYSNLDWVVDYSFFKSPLTFYDKMKAIVGEDKKIYLFLDEVQRLNNPGKFLKGLYDLNANMKIIVSGSSSLEIRSKLKEYLTGRKRETLLYPISLLEWVVHQRSDFYGRVLDTLNKISEKDFIRSLNHFEKIYGSLVKESFNEILTFGGYPKVLCAPQSEKRDVLDEIYTSYIKRDVVEFMKIEKPDLYNNLVKSLAHQVGNLVNYAELSSLLGGNQITIKKYVNILSQTYVIHLLPPLLGNRRNEIKQAHKVFFIDNGLRNLVSGNLSKPSIETDGFALENVVFSEVTKHLIKGNNLFFWRTKGGTEVDFVIDVEKETVIPVEVKRGMARKGQLTKSFHSFIKSYQPHRAIFANQSTIDQHQFGQTTVFYLPYYWIPLISRIGVRA